MMLRVTGHSLATDSSHVAVQPEAGTMTAARRETPAREGTTRGATLFDMYQPAALPVVLYTLEQMNQAEIDWFKQIEERSRQTKK